MSKYFTLPLLTLLMSGCLASLDLERGDVGGESFDGGSDADAQDSDASPDATDVPDATDTADIDMAQDAPDAAILPDAIARDINVPRDAAAPPDAAPCMPADEICNGIDDDCDGRIDEGYGVGEPCAVGRGICERSGVIVCDGTLSTRCAGEPGQPNIESCNGVDDDCDDVTDEGELCPSGPHQSGLCQAAVCVRTCDQNWVDQDGQPGNGCERGCELGELRNIAPLVDQVNPFMASTGDDYVAAYTKDLRIYGASANRVIERGAQVGFTDIDIAMGNGKFVAAANHNEHQLWIIQVDLEGRTGIATHSQSGPPVRGPVGVGVSETGESLGVQVINGDTPESALLIGRSNAEGDVTAYTTIASPNLRGSVRPRVVPWIGRSWMIVTIQVLNGDDSSLTMQILDPNLNFVVAEGSSAFFENQMIESIGIAHRHQARPSVGIAVLNAQNRIFFMQYEADNNDHIVFQVRPAQLDQRYDPDLSVLATPSGWAVIYREFAGQGHAVLYDHNLNPLPMRPLLGPAPRMRVTGDGQQHHAVMLSGGNILHAPVDCE